MNWRPVRPRFALHLKKLGIGPDSVVGLIVTRRFDYCVSVLAILKAGAAFLPIDTELPRERISYMLSDGGVKVVLVSPHLGREIQCGKVQHCKDQYTACASGRIRMLKPGAGRITLLMSSILPVPRDSPRAFRSSTTPGCILCIR